MDEETLFFSPKTLEMLSKAEMLIRSIAEGPMPMSPAPKAGSVAAHHVAMMREQLALAANALVVVAEMTEEVGRRKLPRR